MKLSAVLVVPPAPVRPAAVGSITNEGSAAQPAEQVTVSAAAASVLRRADRDGQNDRAVIQSSGEWGERSISYRRGSGGRGFEGRAKAAATQSGRSAAVVHRTRRRRRPRIDRSRGRSWSCAPFANVNPTQTPGVGEMSRNFQTQSEGFPP